MKTILRSPISTQSSCRRTTKIGCSIINSPFHTFIIFISMSCKQSHPRRKRRSAKNSIHKLNNINIRRSFRQQIKKRNKTVTHTPQKHHPEIIPFTLNLIDNFGKQKLRNRFYDQINHSSEATNLQTSTHNIIVKINGKNRRRQSKPRHSY